MLWYNLLILAGSLIAVAVAVTECRRRGIHWSHGVILPLLVFVLSRFAARFFHALEAGDELANWTYYFSFGSGATSQFAGLYPSIGLICLYCWLVKCPTLRMFDLLVPAACFAVAVGRIGCVVAGCCRGFELPAGWSIPLPIPNQEYFPAAFFEGLFAFVLGLVLLRMPATEAIYGRRTGFFFLSYGVGRFAFQWLRFEEVHWGFLTSTQVLAVPLVALGAWLLHVQSTHRSSTTDYAAQHT
jgi:phosphatidylglycerol---prolipoprotein diacylglyceryl transferase